MDPIDEQITSTLRDGKHMNFEELLNKLSISHNTLRLHLDAMAEKGEIMKEKRPSKTWLKMVLNPTLSDLGAMRGRPRYFYSTVSGPVRRPSPRVNRVTGVVSLSFEKLSQICRREGLAARPR